MSLKRISLLGSTGSIGESTLRLVRQYPEEFQIVSLVGGQNVGLLENQIREFRPQVAYSGNREGLSRLRTQFPEIQIFGPDEGIIASVQAVTSDVTVVGISGFAALEPTFAAMTHTQRLAMANKECLVVAGDLFQKKLQETSTQCIPVDSEHCALFQLLEGQRPEEVTTVVLTASGGPFFRQPELDWDTVTPEMAVAHPNWKMGRKISVDSATLMNKSLEFIEAHFLFDRPAEQIEVWIHPQSLVHGAIFLKDNTCLAQWTVPDMRASIGYAMHYPNRLNEPVARVSLSQLKNLEFYEPDLRRFPSLRLAREALKTGPREFSRPQCGE